MVVQLAVATPWSFYWGASSVEAMAARAAERGVRALGLCDAGGLWGAVPFQKACLAVGVRPIFGVRLCVEGVSVHLIALDAAGWAVLCRLVTRAQCGGRPTDSPGLGHSRVLLDWVAAESGAGTFAVLSHDAIWLSELARLVGKDDLFATTAEAAFQAGLPFVAAPQVVMADPGLHARHRLLVAMGRNMRVGHLSEADVAPASAWLKGGDALKAMFQDAPEALRCAERLAERSNFVIPLGLKHLPRFPGLPKGRTADAHLARLCARGWKRRRLQGRVSNAQSSGPPQTQGDPYAAQLARELDLIRDQGLADYFLVVADLVRWARGQGIHTVGRGSAANSLVCWLLGMTQIDPLKNGLWFDRFLNPGRRDFPDVDLDFAWDERDRVLAYAQKRWGASRVAMLSTHITFAERGAIREVAKAMGLPPAEITAFQRRRRLGGDIEEPWRTVLREAHAIDGFPRHLGVHPGGLILAPGRLSEHLPLQHAKKQAGGRPLVVTQWDMGPVEEIGLLKIDLLGNRGLAVVRDASKMVRANTGLRIDFDRLAPEQDSRTRESLMRGDTMGCFYIESPSMRSLLRKLRCHDVASLTAASSIIRPGISSSGMMRAYIDRFHHVQKTGVHDAAWYLHPRLRELLGETYGVMTYQEDVLRIAQELAGMTASEADGLRKAMSHKRSAERMSHWQDQFCSGLLAAGFGSIAAHELWRQVESFAGYSFCKAHSASYAALSFRSAWLRAHFPAEFMASVLRNHGGFFDTFAYLAEARRMGLQLQLPCVNDSALEFCGGAGALRVGLREIKTLGRALIGRLLAHRPFLAMDDLAQRARPQPAEFEALVRAGACDTLPDGLTRAERMRWVALWRRRRSMCVAEAVGAHWQAPPLFPNQSIPAPPAVQEFSRHRLLELEEEALGWLVSAHPLQLYAQKIRDAGALAARDLPQHVNQRVRLVGWQVTQKPVRTRDGRRMGFLSFEDTTAMYETVLFPDAWRRLAPWTLTRGPYLLEGIPRREFGDITVEVYSLRLFQ
ncbi:MAG: DNA polymerase III subunit alpha [Planctomycetes bacterium]|nr:DNA polymerase III subunit alpha [Planctomycetota bacterium]